MTDYEKTISQYSVTMDTNDWKRMSLELGLTESDVERFNRHLYFHRNEVCFLTDRETQRRICSWRKGNGFATGGLSVSKRTEADDD